MLWCREVRVVIAVFKQRKSEFIIEETIVLRIELEIFLYQFVPLSLHARVYIIATLKLAAVAVEWNMRVGDIVAEHIEEKCYMIVRRRNRRSSSQESNGEIIDHFKGISQIVAT